jgi:glycerol-3-phosphate acyltransferase PlsX
VGTFAPLEAVKGVSAFFAENKTAVHLILIGDERKINNHLQQHILPAGSYSIAHASQVIEMHEHPTKALKEKQHSSLP